MYGVNVFAGACLTIVNSFGQVVTPPPRPGGVASFYPFSATAVMTKLVPNDDNEVRVIILLRAAAAAYTAVSW